MLGWVKKKALKAVGVHQAADDAEFAQDIKRCVRLPVLRAAAPRLLLTRCVSRRPRVRFEDMDRLVSDVQQALSAYFAAVQASLDASAALVRALSRFNEAIPGGARACPRALWCSRLRWLESGGAGAHRWPCPPQSTAPRI